MTSVDKVRAEVPVHPPENPGSGELCRYLKWDSAFFGCRIAASTVETLDSSTADGLLRWCEAQNIDCLYFLAALHHDETIRLLERNRFHLVDARMTFGQAIVSSRPGRVIRPKSRPSIPSDLPILREIARASYHDTRFYYDSHFSRQRVDELYETWIERSCNGFADTVLVVESGRRPVGYVTCHLKESGEGQIGLVGVHDACRGRGVGRVLVKEALRWFAERGSPSVTVVTQGRNDKAMRLYERCGFVARDARLWYHLWFT
jgi:dTDP-4-amino-4,6-dideoxy-D-galactose acyltransferase